MSTDKVLKSDENITATLRSSDLVSPIQLVRNSVVASRASVLPCDGLNSPSVASMIGGSLAVFIQLRQRKEDCWPSARQLDTHTSYFDGLSYQRL